MFMLVAARRHPGYVACANLAMKSAQEGAEILKGCLHTDSSLMAELLFHSSMFTCTVVFGLLCTCVCMSVC